MRRAKNCMKCGGFPKFQLAGSVLPDINEVSLTGDLNNWAWQLNQSAQQIRPIQNNLQRYDPNQMSTGSSPFEIIPILPEEEEERNRMTMLAGLGLQGLTTGLSEISGRVERSRQDRAEQEQMARLGQRNPLPFETLMNSQPNAYSLYARYGGSLKRYQKGGININPENRGKFTEYCGGKVTDECIEKGKNSSNPITRKRATFADNARHWNKQVGGEMVMGSTRVNPTRGAENPFEYYSDSPLMFKDDRVNMADFINNTIGDRMNPMDTEDARVLSAQGFDDNTRALIDYMTIFNNRPDMIKANPQQRLSSFYSMRASDPRVQKQIDDMRSVGTSPFTMYSSSSRRTSRSNRQPLTASKRYGGKK